MSNYQKVNNFAAKDAINAPVVGTEFQNEFDAVQLAVNSKADSLSPSLTGVPTTPTPDGGTADQVVNVEYVSNGAAPIDAQSLRSRNQVIAKTGSQSPNNTNNAGFVFSGDSDSGLFNPTDGRIVLATNGSNKFEINSSQVRIKDDLVAEKTVFLSNGRIILQGTGRIEGVDTVSASTDATNKSYVDGRIAAVNTRTTLFTGAAGSGDIGLSQPYTNFDYLEVYLGTTSSFGGHVVSVDSIEYARATGKDYEFTAGADLFWRIRPDTNRSRLRHIDDRGVVYRVVGIKY